MLVDNVPEEPDMPDEPDVGGVPPDALMAMIGQLPDNYRTVLNLFVFEQRSHREIAKLLGVKESTSSSLFFRAKKMLAGLVKEYINRQAT